MATVSPALSPDVSAQALSRQNFRIILMMLISTFVVILNETIMNVALPRLMVELNVSASTVQWLSTGFLLTMAVVIPVTGFLIQRFSTRTVFIAAMSLFTLGTLTAAVAPTFGVVLAGRIVQASGTAIMLPLLMTTVLALVPPQNRGAMMGTLSTVISVAPAIGPTISGIIIQSLSWRYMFVFVLPIAIGALAYGAWKLEDIGETRRSSVDLLSVLLSALGFGGIVYGFGRAGEGTEGFASPVVSGALIVGGVSLVLFVLRQLQLQRQDRPLLDLRAFEYPMFRLSVVLIMIVMMALFASAILLPMYLQGVRGFSSLQTGLLLLPGGALMGVMAPIVGRLFDRFGPLYLVVGGSALLSLTLFGFTTLSPTTATPFILVLHLTFSLGLSFLFTPVMTSGLNPLPSRLYSHGSAIMSTLQQVAGAVGTALLITIMSIRTEANLGSAASPELAQMSGLHAAFTVGAGIALLALLLSFFMRREQPAVAGDPEAQAVPSAH